MKKTLMVLASCALFLGACDQADKTQESAEASPYATDTGIDFTGFDYNADPAEDFNAYVNGTWMAENTIPGDKGRYGVFDILRDESEADQRLIIEEMANQSGLAPNTDEQRIGALYASLLDASLVEGLGVEPIHQQLDEINAISSKTELQKAFGTNNYLGITSPLATFVIPDLGDSSRYMGYIWQSGLGLPNRDYYLREGDDMQKIRDAYPGYISTLFELAGYDNPDQRAAKVVAIETALANAHWTAVENRDIPKLYNLMNTSDLGTVTEEIDWTTYLDGAGLAGREELVVAQLSYFEALGGLIDTIPLEDWKDYLAFHTLNGAAPFLSSEFEDANFAFLGAIVGGREEKSPRWKTGVRVVNASLGDAVGQVYVKRYFPPEAKAQMETLVANLLEAFRLGIQDLEWMSDETKAKAEEKRSKFSTKIGYPGKWEDYTGMDMIAHDPLGNLTRASAWAYQDMIDQLDEDVDKDEWGFTPQTVNAGYNPTQNSITFPAAILQPPFFNLEGDPAVNYGAIGAVIGHEIGHAFDDQGRRFDGDGNLKDWWTEEDAAAFVARTDELVAQFDAFSPLPDLNVNGKLTLGENIGDLTGVTIAYRAYHASLDGKEAPVIDGLTGDQRFFLGFAQIWRSLSRDEEIRRRILTDPHSPPEYRVIGTLMNIPEFYEAFGIEEGDAMYRPPEDRVKIW